MQVNNRQRVAFCMQGKTQVEQGVTKQMEAKNGVGEMIEVAARIQLRKY